MSDVSQPSAAASESRPPTRRERNLARLAFVARVAIAFGLLVLIVNQLGGAGALLDGLGRLSLWAVVAALAANTADRLLMTWKWTLLLRSRNQQLPLLRGTQIYCASMVWGMFLPATMGSDAVRAVSTVRAGVPSAEVVASIVVERALGLTASLLVGLLGLVAVSALGELPEALAPVWWMGGLVLAGGLTALALSFSERAYRFIHEGLLGRFREHIIMRRLREWHDTYKSFGSHKRALTVFWWFSVLEQLGPVVPIWILALSLGVSISPLYLAGAVTLSFLVARVPISLGGIGVMEGSLAFLLSLVGIPWPLAVTLAVAARIVEVASWLPWWGAFTLRAGSARRPAS